jgi:hypothetical protein
LSQTLHEYIEIEASAKSSWTYTGEHKNFEKLSNTPASGFFFGNKRPSTNFAAKKLQRTATR